MRNLYTLFAFLCIVILSQAVAAEPEAKPAAPAQISSQSGASRLAAATATAGSPAADRAKEAGPDRQIKRLRALGYRPKMVAGATLYCRNEPVIGSRFVHQLCGTADDVEKATQSSQDAVDDIQRRSLMFSP